MAVDVGLSPEDLTSVPVAVGAKKTNESVTPKVVTCIVCQEEQEITAEGPPVVLTALVQQSMVLSRLTDNQVYDPVSDYNPLFVPENMFTGAHSNSCGHVMHGECWQKYFDARRLLTFAHRHSVEIDKNEYLCPLCGALCNSVLPMLPKISQQAEQSQSVHSDCPDAGRPTQLPESLDDFIALIDRTVKTSNMEQKLFDDQSASVDHGFTFGARQSVRSFLRRLIGRGEDSSPTVESLLRSFSRAVYSSVLGSPAEEFAPRLLTMSWATCSFTIQAIESYLSKDSKPLFGGLTSRQSECLDSLIAYAHGSGAILAPYQAEKNAFRLWKAFSSNGDDLASPSILELNLFGMMVNFRFSMPFLLALSFCDEPTDFYAALDHHVVRLFDVLIVVQTLLSCRAEDEDDAATAASDDEPDIPLNPEEAEPSVAADLNILWGRCHAQARNMASVPDHPRPKLLLRTVLRKRQSFLRCSSLFFRFLTNIDSPLVLRDYVEPLPAPTERQVLCSYLDLPLNPVSLLNDAIHCLASSPLRKMIDSMCSSPMTMSAVTSDKLSGCRPLRKVPIELPPHYSQCISQASGFRCPSTGDASRSPALCLVCGVMLCSQSFCCQTEVDGTQVGACTVHSLRCGNGVGMFLQVRDCEILLLYNMTKGCFLPPPYLDEYGEADHGFRRGNPLFLSKERYESLINTWRLHNIPETIARQQEKSKSLLAYHWSDF